MLESKLHEKYQKIDALNARLDAEAAARAEVDANTLDNAKIYTDNAIGSIDFGQIFDRLEELEGKTSFFMYDGTVLKIDSPVPIHINPSALCDINAPEFGIVWGNGSSKR